MLAAADLNNEGWQATLKLGFRKTLCKTILAERTRQGPLAVQRALYPEGDLCHIYLLHPPGGVAGGDRLNITVDSASGTSALVTTPGATKFYRSAGQLATQQQSLAVTDATLEWLPQENILFPGAVVELATKVELKGKAAFIGWEINSLGRPVNNERFDWGNAIFRYSLFRDGVPLLLERMEIDGDVSLCRAAGIRGCAVIGTLYATTTDSALLEKLRSDLPQSEDHQLGITLVDGLLIARFLGNSTERARNLFTQIWKLLRSDVIQRPPCKPRIWNT